MSVSNRLPKQFWRVTITEGKVGIYELGSKTYAAEGHALAQQKRLLRKGVKAEVWSTGPVSWTLTSPAGEIEGQEPLF